MILLISWIQILQLSQLLLHNSVGLCGQIELLNFDKELIDFIQLVVAPKIAWLAAASSAHCMFLEGLDLAVVIVLYFLEYIANSIPSLFLVKAIVSVCPLHELLNSTHLFGEDLVEPSQPLVKAVDLKHLLPLLATLVPDDKSNQEQQGDWLVLRLVDSNGVIHEHSTLRFRQRGVHLHKLESFLFEFGQFIFSLAILWQRVILLHVVDEGDFAHFDDLVIVSKDNFLNAESLDGLNAELSVILYQV